MGDRKKGVYDKQKPACNDLTEAHYTWILTVHMGRVFTTPILIVSLNIPVSGLFADFVKRLKNDRCFHG